ncbi:MAG: hypothetical protein U0469_02155 [Candidatus Paceibacterota bacterium]|jgi:hypothetical protein
MFNQQYQILFTILSTIVGIYCFIPYISDIFKGKTKPHLYTWFIWTILQTVGVLAMLNAGAKLGVLSLAFGAILCFFIFILSFFYGTKNIKLFDKICLMGALIAVIIYFFLNNPFWSVIVVTITDLVGFLPTIRKSFEEPETETFSTYFFSSLSSLFALGALSYFSLTTSVYLISLFLSNGVCAGIILFRKKK